jgi:PAS domain S-box-containing protein
MVRDKSLRPDPWPPVGEFRYVARDGRWEWSEEVAHMHGYEPATVTPTTELVLAHQHPNDRATMANLIEQVRRHGAPFSGRQRIIDTRGEEHLVIVVTDRFYEDGAPAGADGFYVDITQQLKAAVQERLSKAVLAVSARRAVIDQAIGMLMLRYGLTADSAFQLLTRLSQESNIKLRVIAERVVANAAAGSTILDDMSVHVDTLLRNGTESI